jgi:hypothetical protein
MTDETETKAAPKGKAAKPTAADMKKAGMPDTVVSAVLAADMSGPAGVPPAGSDAISGSGGIVEPVVTDAIDVSHPAVDNNPRADTTVNQNKIDFNDPTASQTEAVETNMSQG